MNDDAESLKLALAAYLVKVESELDIQSAAYDGGSDLVLEELGEALRSGNQENLTKMLSHAAQVFQAGGYNRGRFEVIHDVLQIIQKWDADLN